MPVWIYGRFDSHISPGISNQIQFKVTAYYLWLPYLMTICFFLTRLARSVFFTFSFLTFIVFFEHFSHFTISWTFFTFTLFSVHLLFPRACCQVLVSPCHLNFLGFFWDIYTFFFGMGGNIYTSFFLGHLNLFFKKDIYASFLDASVLLFSERSFSLDHFRDILNLLIF